MHGIFSVEINCGKRWCGYVFKFVGVGKFIFGGLTMAWRRFALLLLLTIIFSSIIDLAIMISEPMSGVGKILVYKSMFKNGVFYSYRYVLVVVVNDYEVYTGVAGLAGRYYKYIPENNTLIIYGGPPLDTYEYNSIADSFYDLSVDRYSEGITPIDTFVSVVPKSLIHGIIGKDSLYVIVYAEQKSRESGKLYIYKGSIPFSYQTDKYQCRLTVKSINDNIVVNITLKELRSGSEGYFAWIYRSDGVLLKFESPYYYSILVVEDDFKAKGLGTSIPTTTTTPSTTKTTQSTETPLSTTTSSITTPTTTTLHTLQNNTKTQRNEGINTTYLIAGIIIAVIIISIFVLAKKK